MRPLLLVALGLCAPPVWAEQGRVFRAGASAMEVNPPAFPVHVLGMFTDRTSDQIQDDLFARCLVLDDGLERLAMVVVDSCMMPRDLLDQAKELARAKTGIPTNRMLISATQPVARDVTGQHPASYEPGVAFYLDGPSAPGFSEPDQINRAAHFAGGRLAAKLKKLSDRYTLSLWFWNELANDRRPVTGYLFSRGLDMAQGAPGDHVGIGGTHEGARHQGRLIFFNGNALNQVLAGHTIIQPKTWNHLVLVRQEKKVTVYLNGHPEPEISGEAEIGYPAGTGQIFLGGRNDNFANFQGKLDEVALYDRALSVEETVRHRQASGDWLFHSL